MRDHRLVGEGLEQRDLLVGEGPRPRSRRHVDDADGALPRAAAAWPARVRMPACRTRASASGNSARAAPARSCDVDRLPLTHRAARPEPRGIAAMVRRSASRRRSARCAATRRSISPSTRKIAASLGAAEPRGALGDRVSTGCRSVGELAMTRRISPVAVCCSSASVRSRLRVLPAPGTAGRSRWRSRPGRRRSPASAICSLVNGLALATRAMTMTPMSVALAQQRRRQRSSGQPSSCSTWRRHGYSPRPAGRSCDVERPPVDARPGRSRSRDSTGRGAPTRS